jgi:hypothetical protein
MDVQAGLLQWRGSVTAVESSRIQCNLFGSSQEDTFKVCFLALRTILMPNIVKIIKTQLLSTSVMFEE